MNSLSQVQATSHKEVEFWRDLRMPYVETRRACHSRICYQAHSHATFSIGAVDQGLSQFSSHFAAPCLIQAGDLVSIPAQVEHSCNPLPNQAWSYQMMHLDAAWLAQLMAETALDLQHPQLPQLQPIVVRDPRSYAVFCQLNQNLFNPLLSIIEKEQCLIDGLSQLLLPAFDWHKVIYRDSQQQLIKALLNLLASADRVEPLLSLSQLAEDLSISRFAVIRLFKQTFGLTPHAYQLNQRIQQARQLMDHGQPIVDLAQQLGFCDQSHFHRVFKAHLGVTPKQYQQKYKN